MSRKLWRVFAGLCALAVAVVLAAPVVAQMSEVKEKPPMYSYVGFWNIPRAQWAEMDECKSRRPAGTGQGLVERNDRGLRRR